jgi:hypothetical protein
MVKYLEEGKKGRGDNAGANPTSKNSIWVFGVRYKTYYSYMRKRGMVYTLTTF